jgi:hypothetical protein
MVIFVSMKIDWELCRKMGSLKKYWPLFDMKSMVILQRESKRIMLLRQEKSKIQKMMVLNWMRELQEVWVYFV